jgi:hypothetical protein
MKIAPFIDPDGIARERERAAYRAELISERNRFLIAFLPVAEDGLTCLEFVNFFSIAVRRGVDRETACALVTSLREHGAGLDAVYGRDPDRPQPPTFRNVMPLRAAMTEGGR